jgi:hypothetical protein
MSSLLAEGEASSANVTASRYSAYLLYWHHKSTNTDAEGAAGGSGLVQRKAGAG